ncbi:MAG: TetR/AcrR family transcriptional regulator [Acidobacteriaceae bacterium]
MQNTEYAGHGRPGTEERILAAAATLFGQMGFNGASTRDIASVAEVNEVTIYRHYPRKRDLYVAVLAAQLGRVSLHGDLLAGIAQAADARQALTRTFELIATTLMRDPELLRLVLYSSLELQGELDLLLRRHLGELVEVVARYIEPWVIKGDLCCGSAKGLVLALISIVVLHQPLHRAFSAEPATPRNLFETFAEICLAGGPLQPGQGEGADASPQSTGSVRQYHFGS